MEKHKIVVIGAGPAGVAAALEAAALGGDVTLIHAEPIGGRATWHSLIPSKVYLSAADRMEEAEHQAVLGLTGATPVPSLAAMKDRITREAQAWSQRQTRQLAEAGVIVVAGKAKLTGPSQVVVEREGAGDQILSFENVIIASGSVPIFLPDIKPDGRRILAPRLAGKLAEWPEHLIMIGGGVTGAEFVYFFSRMGFRVTLVTDQPAILPRIDAELVAGLEQSLVARGVAILKSAPVAAVHADDKSVRVTLQDGRRLDGSHAFIAIGRRPDVADLGLASAGIEHNGRGVVIDAFCRTRCPSVYAAGDAAGPPYVANRALAQARVAARQALGAGSDPFRPDAVVEAIYTSPQLATVGLSEMQAAAERIDIIVRRISYVDALKPRLIGTTEGVVKIVVAAENNRILGAGAFGSHAADVLTPVALAIAKGLGLEDLAELFPAYPSVSELAFIPARGYAC